MSHTGDTLRFAGALSRDAVPALWKQLPPLDGVRTLDLAAVTSIDSAGLALLAELAARASGAPLALALPPDGAPDGFTELCAAYRLDPRLGFAA